MNGNDDFVFAKNNSYICNITQTIMKFTLEQCLYSIFNIVRDIPI